MPIAGFFFLDTVGTVDSEEIALVAQLTVQIAGN